MDVIAVNQFKVEQVVSIVNNHGKYYQREIMNNHINSLTADIL